MYDNSIYTKKLNKYLFKLYYLISWKNYLKEEKT